MIIIPMSRFKSVPFQPPPPPPNQNGKLLYPQIPRPVLLWHHRDLLFEDYPLRKSLHSIKSTAPYPALLPLFPNYHPQTTLYPNVPLINLISHLLPPLLELLEPPLYTRMQQHPELYLVHLSFPTADALLSISQHVRRRREKMPQPKPRPNL